SARRLLLFIPDAGPHRALHSFPTRRSSDLMGCYFYAMQRIPLANAVSLQFTKPLFQIILAIWFLSEVIRWRRGVATLAGFLGARSEEHTSELQSRENLVCRLLLEKKK